MTARRLYLLRSGKSVGHAFDLHIVSCAATTSGPSNNARWRTVTRLCPAMNNTHGQVLFRALQKVGHGEMQAMSSVASFRRLPCKNRLLHDVSVTRI
jgi:hypothetical protein